MLCIRLRNLDPQIITIICATAKFLSHENYWLYGILTCPCMDLCKSSTIGDVVFYMGLDGTVDHEIVNFHSLLLLVF